MSSKIPSQFTSLSILFLVFGGLLVLIPQNNPAQAQISKNGFLIAQSALPQLQPMEPVEFNQPNPNSDSYSTTQISQSNQNFERYFVYVDSSNMQTLQQVRQVESSAYIREYNGRNVIQSGIFTRQSNAQERVRELELKGVSGARVVSFSNTEPISYYSGAAVPFSSPSSDSVITKPVNAYYVIIPSNKNNLRYIAQQIQKNIGRNSNVFQRNQPRGAHIAVGPFSDRSMAEQWNNYLQKSGYGNARVYYGK
ncbi:hypothetical protein [Trichormus variabilis]|uniref:SPOR domain-containing protein n=1 Tax=Trichormus variabilis SAG 1403-4b TaxID=447716 RepID=A0A3S1A7X0_ANAVA|nr:hypothetical protein [Trichormus variabilis]MBD2624941.1 hypothetical protein [Trichormus variabilis FACHB-164]RUS95125.1 hypothetical protein DSM107003_33250 [Trichormus variabilis SAG 1403-4b]